MDEGVETVASVLLAEDDSDIRELFARALTSAGAAGGAVNSGGEALEALRDAEFDLLVNLATRPRTVLPRERLLAEVWGWADASGTRTVDSHIKALRRKLGSDLIRTVHGVGYALEAT